MGGICPCLNRKSPSKENKIIADLKAQKKPIFWVFGGPGSGKGTQCSRLAKKYKLVPISSGDLLRSEVASNSKLGKDLNEMMLTGQLVPREIVLGLLKTAIINSYDNAAGFLIDGYPREVIQGEEFEELIGPCKQIIYLHCSDETMKERLLQRGVTSGRVDDKDSTIMNRIKIFHEQSEPVIRKYADITCKISGEKDPDDVFAECCNVVERCM